MAKKKSASQLRRMETRAAARGQEYHYVPPENNSVKDDDAANPPQNDATEEVNQNESTEQNERDANRLKAAEKLKKALRDIEANEELKSKDRRAAKRKVEAIASEESGMPTAELLEWSKKHQPMSTQKGSTTKGLDPKTAKRKQLAEVLKKELNAIETDESLKSKDRRSAKRKAEAIAAEKSGMAVEELLDWYDKFCTSQPKKKSKSNHDPYIAFIGQLSFDTNQEELFEHIKTNLVDTHKVTKENIKIRILTDAKSKKSRGMAFVEVLDDPEMLYALLKLHQTYLKGRRINVERSAGGKKNSKSRKDKISQYRKEQEEYFGDVVDSILSEYKKTGELRDDELDAGVLALCKRHSGRVVRAAVSKYIEGGGRDMDNPSAYLTFLLTKFAEEGVYEEKENTKHSKGPKRILGDRRSSTGGGGGGGSAANDINKRFKASSEFSRAGVDMSMSEAGAGIAKIFPSAKRGRGRGYM